MDLQTDKIQFEVQHLYRRHYGKLVSSVLFFSKDIDLETAEDLVQDAFSKALTYWKDQGIPESPLGWIYTVCKNKAINQINNHQKKFAGYENENLNSYEHQFNDSAFDDHQLRILFACSFPDFSPKIQVVITLKYVVNLRIETIAKIFGMSIDGIDKLLSRAKQKIKEENILLHEPDAKGIRKRLPIVHKIIYLIFNEGYKSSSGKEILNKELCEEALLLNKSLLESPFGNKHTAALHALMLLNASRLDARFDASGELLGLEEQDRKLWNKELIVLGCKYLKKSRGQNISEYHYEASIAYMHCITKSFAETNWLSIAKLYEKLLATNANPFVELNFAIALYYSGQKDKAWNLLGTLQRNTFLNQYYLLNATLGKIHLIEGNHAKAKEYLEKTLSQTHFEIEKNYIKKLIKKTKKISEEGDSLFHD